MEEDETQAEWEKLVEDKDAKIKGLEDDISKKNDRIVELENYVIKRDDGIYDIKREVYDL